MGKGAFLLGPQLARELAPLGQDGRNLTALGLRFRMRLDERVSVDAAVGAPVAVKGERHRAFLQDLLETDKRWPMSSGSRKFGISSPAPIYSSARARFVQTRYEPVDRLGECRIDLAHGICSMPAGAG